jgi:ParB family chromosome partitioning protein
VGFGDSGQTDSDGGTSYRVVPVALISRNPWQPREMFHEEQIRELAQSIESAGLMQPLVVRAKGKGFELIAGERRLRALTLLKRTEAPVVIHDVDDQIAAEWALIENLQREDLNPMERATAMQRLVVEFDLTHEELADRLGLKRASVTNILSLNHLDAKTAALVRAGSLSAGHAKCLLSVDSLAERSRLAEACVKESWPVRKLEQETKRTRERSTGNNRLPATRSISAHVADLERQLTEHLGTKVTIQMGRKPNTGRVVLQFYSNAQFDGLLQAMNFSNDGL